MDCHIDRPSRSLLRYVKRHKGQQEKEIIGHFNDPSIPNALYDLFEKGCLRYKEIICLSVCVEEKPSASLIDRKWEITPKGMDYLTDRFFRCFVPLLGLAVSIIVPVVIRLAF